MKKEFKGKIHRYDIVCEPPLVMLDKSSMSSMLILAIPR